MTTDSVSTKDTGGQLGWVVSWKVPPEVSITALRDALRLANLDSELAGDMTTQNALRRALRDMNESRVIRKLRVEGESIYFQITHEDRQDTLIEYRKEAEVQLDQATGIVSCDVPELAEQARTLLHEHLAKRLTTDLTRLVQRIFDRKKADLVPIREQGGAYFVPDHCADLVEQSRTLLTAIGGKLRSFAVRLGCGDTKESVAEALTEYLADLVGRFRESIEGISAESRADVLVRRAEKIGELRQKLSTYRGLLSGYAESLSGDIDAADKQLMAAITENPTEGSQPEPVAQESLF